MIKVAKRLTDPFARVSKEALADARLSWKAKGLLAYLSIQPNRAIRRNDLVRELTDVSSTSFRDAVIALNELIDLGYVTVD